MAKIHQRWSFVQCQWIQSISCGFVIIGNVGTGPWTLGSFSPFLSKKHRNHREMLIFLGCVCFLERKGLKLPSVHGPVPTFLLQIVRAYNQSTGSRVMFNEQYPVLWLYALTIWSRNVGTGPWTLGSFSPLCQWIQSISCGFVIIDLLSRFVRGHRLYNTQPRKWNEPLEKHLYWIDLRV
jgi:hypothetical protein